MKELGGNVIISACGCGCNGVQFRTPERPPFDLLSEQALKLRDYLLEKYPLIVGGELVAAAVVSGGDVAYPPQAHDDSYVAPTCKQNTEKWCCCQCGEAPIPLHRKTCAVCQHERCLPK